jgi:sirohydrochlorin ferrochelatase
MEGGGEAGGAARKRERESVQNLAGLSHHQISILFHPFPSSNRTITGRPVVFPAHMEIAPPSISDAVASCVAAGARKVVIAPYFLSQGRHITEDVPALAAAAAATNASALPGGVVVSAALGGDEMLARLLEARVVDALKGGGAAA